MYQAPQMEQVMPNYQNRVKPLPMPQQESVSAWELMKSAVPQNLGEVQNLLGIEDMSPSKSFDASKAPKQDASRSTGVAKSVRGY